MYYIKQNFIQVLCMHSIDVYYITIHVFDKIVINFTQIYYYIIFDIIAQ